MSFRPATIRVARSRLFVCRLRASQPTRHYAVPVNAKTLAQARADLDYRNRNAHLTSLRNDRLLAFTVPQAHSFIDQFLAGIRDGADPLNHVRRLASKYRVTIGDVANLAIPLLRVPDAYRSKMPLPPSEHPRTAVALLLACTAAQDSSATLQIAAAVYHRDNSRIPGAKELARLLSSDEIKFAEGMMERLAEEGDATAMTLLGKFKERAGLEFEAISWYERAVEKCDTTFNPRYPHPSALPIESPWMSLLMATERTPVEREKIKKALEKGALKAGDPLAYYHLATSEAEDGNDGRWLTYTTKAAASGIVEAAYDLGRYYKELSTGPADSIPDDQVKKMLKFALTWKSGSVQALAREWFAVAATAGHKPAMLELVGITTLEDDVEGAKAWLQRITESPPVNENEKWPKLVERAKRMLAEPSLLAASTPSASPSRPPPASKNHGTVDPKKTGPVGKGEQPRKATVPGPAKRKPA